MSESIKIIMINRSFLRLIVLVVISMTSINLSCNAQNTVLSQYYLAPTITNPAFTGMTQHLRFNLNYRYQFSGFGVPYKTMFLAADREIKSIHSGVGMKLQLDNAGNGILTDLAAGFLYAYDLQIREKLKLKLGVDLTMHQLRLNRSKLIFGDQLDPSLGVISNGGVPIESADLIPNDSKIYPTVGFGLMAYNDLFYAGFSMNNLNTPDGSFLADFEDGDVPILTTVQFGMTIDLDDIGISNSRTSINPLFNYSKQKLAQQFMLGAIFHTDFVQFGAMYRHANSNPDAIIFSLGLERDAMRIGYCYDLTVSSIAGASGGTHELGLLVNLDKLYGENKFDINDCFSIFR